MCRGMILKYAHGSIAVDKISETFFYFTIVAKVHNFHSLLHKWVTQPMKNTYKYYPTYRAIDCAK